MKYSVVITFEDTSAEDGDKWARSAFEQTAVDVERQERKIKWTIRHVAFLSSSLMLLC